MRRSIAALILPLLVLAACGGASEASGNGKLQVVATTGMIGDAAKQIGGDLVEVSTLMGPGVDPHLYKASAGDVGRLNEADLVLYNGLHLEAAMADVLGESETVNAVAVAENIDEADLLRPAEFGGQFDPHVWFDVSLWSKAVERVRDALVELDPENSDAYQANAQSYLQELAALHDYVKAQALRIPEERRVIITAHDAFNYFGRAYGLEVRGLLGISTAAEAGTRDISALAALIAERRIPAIFVETSVSGRSIEAVRAAVRSNGFEVRIGGELFSDALGDAGTEEGTYQGMVRHNIDTLVKALGEAS
ncbi:MAG TPA: zinc ABC transporter substrate-binding protein [Actinomycetota bacterium]|nr:zinc ABC transporter substrate-binding protein [Actinomycetota bacterium]